MSDPKQPKLSRWPFLVSDLLLLGLAGFIVFQGARPLEQWEVIALLACVAFGASLCVLPFLVEHRAATRLSEADRLASTVAQIQKVEAIADQIRSATAQWGAVQDRSSETVSAATKIADRMTAETKEFFHFLEKADATEKNHLKLEIDKLRRAEGDWLQITTALFDHIFALTKAAEKSEHPSLHGQLCQFQNACRDIARRVGLVSFMPEKNQAFESRFHDLADPELDPPKGSRIAEALAPGFTYQGQLYRRAMVKVQGSDGESPMSDDQKKGATAELDGSASTSHTAGEESGDASVQRKQPRSSNMAADGTKEADQEQQRLSF